MKPGALAWLAVLLPTGLGVGLRMLHAEPVSTAGLLGAVPALLLALAALWVGRRGASPQERRLAKELRQVLLPALVVLVAGPLLALPDAVAVVGPHAPTAAAALFLLGAPMAVAAGFGPELEGPLLLEYLARPLSRRRLIAEKWVVSAAVVVAGLAGQGAQAGGWAMPVGVALLALGLVPLLLMRVRHATFSALAAAGLGAALGGLPVAAPLAVGAAGAVAAVAAALFWRGLDGLAREPLAEALLGRLVAVRGRRSPLLALAAKELQLHLGSALAMGAMPVAWAVQRVMAPADVIAGEVTLLFLGMVVATWSGVAPVLAEHRYGTLHQDRAALPTALVWRAKAGVTLGVALLGGAALPLVLSAAAGGAIGWRDVGMWTLFTVMASGVGLVASALLRDLSRAFLAALGATMGLVGAFGASLMAGVAMLPSLPPAVLGTLGGLDPALRAWLMGALLALQGGLVAWLAFALARRAWLDGGVRWRPWLGVAAALVATSLGAGLAQAVLLFGLA